MHLTFAEEFLLLALDDKGCFLDIPPMALEYGLAGALLMELAIAGRIDADIDNLILVDKTPLGVPLLDDALALLTDEQHSVKRWVKEIVMRLPDLRQRVTASLIQNGVLKLEEHKVLWVFSTRRYPCIDNREEEEVLRRIRRTVLEDIIPDPRDIVLISLVYACDLIDEIFSEKERHTAVERVAEISKMDLIGQAVNNAVQELSRLITSAVTSVTSMSNPMRV